MGRVWEQPFHTHTHTHIEVGLSTADPRRSICRVPSPPLAGSGTPCANRAARRKTAGWRRQCRDAQALGLARTEDRDADVCATDGGPRQRSWRARCGSLRTWRDACFSLASSRSGCAVLFAQPFQDSKFSTWGRRLQIRVKVCVKILYGQLLPLPLRILPWVVHKSKRCTPEASYYSPAA